MPSTFQYNKSLYFSLLLWQQFAKWQINQDLNYHPNSTSFRHVNVTGYSPKLWKVGGDRANTLDLLIQKFTLGSQSAMYFFHVPDLQ